MSTVCRMIRIGRFLCAAVPLFCIGPAPWAQGKIDARLMQLYGGVLAPECGNYLLPQLLYTGDSLVVREAGKAVLTGRKVKAAPKYFGDTTPPQFETALTSEVADGEALVFVLYRSASGVFATVEGGPKVMAAVPAVLKGKRIKHCDPNRNVAPGTSPPVELFPGAMLKDARFKRTYVQALGPLAREPWLMALDGPAQPVRKVQIAGTEYQLLSVCKNHDCYDNSMVVLHSASQTVYGKVFQRGRSTLIGAPPPSVAAELERLWRATYRSAK